MLPGALAGVVTLLAPARAEPPAHSMNETTFQAFYELTSRGLWSYLSRLTGNPSLADDFLQEAYLRFLKANVSGRSEGECKSYLYRIATNLVTDHFRKHKREVSELPDTPSPERLSESVQARSDVSRSLAQLSPRERGMLWLAYVEGASHREIAHTIDVKEQSVRPMLFRARQKFIALLRKMEVTP